MIMADTSNESTIIVNNNLKKLSADLHFANIIEPILNDKNEIVTETHLVNVIISLFIFFFFLFLFFGVLILKLSKGSKFQ
jgi:hypothetical protein